MILKIYGYIKKKLPYQFKYNLKAEQKKILRYFQQISSKKIVKSKYGIVFKKNWEDQTFRYMVNASYGYFIWEYLSNISTKFIFVDIGSNQGLG